MRHLDPAYAWAGLGVAAAVVVMCIPTAIVTADRLYGQLLTWLVVRREERAWRRWAAAHPTERTPR